MIPILSRIASGISHLFYQMDPTISSSRTSQELPSTLPSSQLGRIHPFLGRRLLWITTIRGSPSTEVGGEVKTRSILVLSQTDSPTITRRTRPQTSGVASHTISAVRQPIFLNYYATQNGKGSSAAIYGIFTWSNLGLISLTFTLDGQPLSKSYRVEADTPQFVSELGQQQNFLFYSFDFLQSGDHTLVVNVTDCVNQTFAFDFLTYTPSFSTLASMPNLTQGSTGASNGSQSNSKKSSTGIIVGGIAGAVLLVLLFALVFIFRRRRILKGKGYKPGVFCLQLGISVLTLFVVYPFVHAPPDVTIIPLSHQRNPPSTDLYQPEGMQPLPLPPADIDSSNQPFDEQTDRVNPRESDWTRNADTSSVYRGRGEDTRQWEGSDGELSPPSYDETTGGRGPPTHISYIIHR